MKSLKLKNKMVEAGSAANRMSVKETKLIDRHCSKSNDFVATSLIPFWNMMTPAERL